MSSTDVSKMTPTAAKPKINIANLLIEGRAFGALLVIIIFFSLMSPNYLTISNLLIMSSHVAIYGILAIGMLLVILTGGIDLSVGSVLGLAGIIAGFLMQGVTFAAGVPTRGE